MTAKLFNALWQGAHQGVLDLDPLPEVDVEEGQSLQLRILENWLKSGEALEGYKVGLTSGQARDAFGAGIRPFGYILKSRVFQSGDSVSLQSIGRMGLENELVFRLGAPLRGDDVTAAQARGAVESVAAGFEINQTRIRGRASPGVHVADNLSQWGVVTGEFRSPDIAFDDLTVTLALDGAVIQTVAAAGHIDDHFESIATLANRLFRFKRHLRPGTLVITGAFTRHPVERVGTWEGDFGDAGKVSIRVE